MKLIEDKVVLDQQELNNMKIKQGIDKLKFILEEKSKMLKTQQFDKAAQLRDKELKIRLKLGYLNNSISTLEIIEELRIKKRTEIINSIIDEE